MDTLVVWGFDTSEGAESALRSVERLQTRRLAAIDDAAVVVWETDARRPHGYQVGTADGTAALSGAFWGLLFGQSLLLPLAGGQATADALSRIGLPDPFLAAVRDRVTPGTSALFVVADAAAVEVLDAALTDRADRLVRTLPPTHEAALRRAFGADDSTDTTDSTAAATARDRRRS